LKKELNKRVKMVLEGIPDKITGMQLRILESLRDEAIRVKEISSEKMKNRYDKKVHDRQFAIGDEVLVYDSTLLKQWSRKLEERWLGPYVILWKGSLGAYAVEVNGKQKMVSGDQLKAYHRRM
jgi:transposase-like protein